MSTAPVMSRPKERAPYQPFGGALKAWRSRRREVLMCGPSNTGKSRGALEKLHYCMDKYPNSRGLMLRKTMTSLRRSAMVTYEQKVLPQGWLGRLIRFNTTDQQYEYPNGSIIAVGGLDDAQKVMSSEWDMIYPQEATELTETDWEALSIRLRWHSMPYQQLLGDCNPGPPSHWLKKRCDRGQTMLIESRHVDNPSFTQEDQEALDNLTGVWRKRRRDGLWAAAEGMVYEMWDSAIHVIDRFAIPAHWPRYWTIDWGFRNPFVWQAWAQDYDGSLYRYREIYATGRLVEDLAHQIMRVTQDEPRPVAVICDHDAEDRATFEKHAGVRTIPAKKAISIGIQTVSARLRSDKRGKPGMYFLRDSLIDRDPELDKKKVPACTEEEFESYEWDTTEGRKIGEVPVDKYNHGMDCNRYICMHVDGPSSMPLSDDDTPVPEQQPASSDGLIPFTEPIHPAYRDGYVPVQVIAKPVDPFEWTAKRWGDDW